MLRQPENMLTSNRGMPANVPELARPIAVRPFFSEELRTDSGQPSRRRWLVPGTTQDHTGGCIGFGPDGFLYLAMGDTSPQQDPPGHGQDLTTQLARILRVDVDRPDAGLAYAIPADNPFVEESLRACAFANLEFRTTPAGRHEV